MSMRTLNYCQPNTFYIFFCYLMNTIVQDTIENRISDWIHVKVRKKWKTRWRPSKLEKNLEAVIKYGMNNKEVWISDTSKDVEGKIMDRLMFWFSLETPEGKRLSIVELAKNDKLEEYLPKDYPKKFIKEMCDTIKTRF